MFKNIVCFFLAALVLISCSREKYPVVTTEELVKYPDKYESKTIAVEGEVKESQGEDTYFLLLPYVATTVKPCKMGDTYTTCLGTEIKMSLSQVKVGRFRFASEGYSVTVAEHTGGLYLPIPIVPAGSPMLPKGRIIIIGNWTKDNQGNFYLYVSGTEPIPTPLP